MIPQYIAKITLAVISISILIYLFVFKVPELLERYYCSQVKGVPPKGCLKYIPTIQTFYFKDNKEKIIENIAGLIISCYRKSLEENKRVNYCYELIIKNESVDIEKNEIINFIKHHSDFDINLIEFKKEKLEPFQDLFIIFNESRIVIWQSS